MNKKTLMIVGIVVAVLVIAGAANRFLGKSAAERALGDLTGGQADVSGNGDVTVKTDDGTWSTSDKLPANFPSDVPVYAGAKVQASVEAAQQQGGGNYVALETSDSVEKVVAWYKSEVVAKGWVVSTNLAVDEGVMLGATKDSRSLVVTVTKDSDKTVIGLMVAQQ